MSYFYVACDEKVMCFCLESEAISTELVHILISHPHCDEQDLKLVHLLLKLVVHYVLKLSFRIKALEGFFENISLIELAVKFSKAPPSVTV